VLLVHGGAIVVAISPSSCSSYTILEDQIINKIENIMHMLDNVIKQSLFNLPLVNRCFCYEQLSTCTNQALSLHFPLSGLGRRLITCNILLWL